MESCNPQTSAIEIGNVDPDIRARLEHLASERGWHVVSESQPASPRVRIVDESEWVEVISLVENGPPNDVPSVVQIVLASGDDPEGPGSRRAALRLPRDADDDTWAVVIDNALESARRLDELSDEVARLREISTTDDLTQVFNRMHMLEILQREFKRHQRTGDPLATLMVDIDFFKNVNDTYGHKFGDQVLMDFAALLRDSVRESDVVGRYGGEEFICILPETDLEGAMALAEKLRATFESHRFSQGLFKLDLTASFGVAAVSAEVATADALIQLSDRALYRAKRAGRNRVCHAEAREGELIGPEGLPRAAGPESDAPHILIAHPDPESLPFFEELKANAQVLCECVPDSTELLAYLARQTPALLVLDDGLSPLRGLEVLQAIKPQTYTSYFPIVLLSTEPDFVIPPESRIASPDDIIPADADFADLWPRFQLLLRLKSLQDRFQQTYDRLTTARARLVKAERMSTLGQMASGMAHDFNNILSAILGRTEHLLHEVTDEGAKYELGIIHQAASDGAETIGRIQKFSRAISVLDSETVSIGEMVEDCIKLTQTRWKDEAERNGVAISIENKVDSNCLTNANASEIREIFLNLIVNALEAMPGGGEIEIRSAGFDPQGRSIIEVVDSGTGMDAEVASRVFEPFFTRKAEGGTGLGLSIAYGIMTRLGGDIEVRSALGRGATFALHFPPATLATGSATLAEAAPEPVAPIFDNRMAPLRILIVDDEPQVRGLFVEVLKEAGHAVADADCVATGMEIAADRDFDILISDLSMPGRPGWDIVKFVKDRRSETRVILVTGWREDYSSEFLEVRGVDLCLPKPVSLNTLFDAIRELAPAADDADELTA